MSLPNLDDHRAHLCVSTEYGVRVMPVALIEDVVKGRQESSLLTEPVLRRIIFEWLEGVKGNG